MKRHDQVRHTGTVMALVGWVCIASIMVPPAQAGNYHALIVGINHYSPSYISSNNLTSCRNNAIGYRNTLRTDTNRWKTTRITTLLDSAANESAILSRIRTKTRSLRAGDVFVYYHASHGDQIDGRDCVLCTYSSDLTDQELGQALSRFRSGVKIIIILDACFSGGMFKNGQSFGSVYANNVLHAYMKAGSAAGDPSKALGRNIAFMTSSDYDERSWELHDHLSLYTQFFLEACTQPKADNCPTNGYFSFWEVHQYAQPLVSEEEPSQTPQFRNYGLLKKTTMIRVRVGTPTPITPFAGISNNPQRPRFSWTRVDGAHHYRVQIFKNGRLIKDQNGIRNPFWIPPSSIARGRYSWRVAAYSYANHPGRWSSKIRLIISPISALRHISLTWKATPRDLDLHLYTPSGAHVYSLNFGNRTTAPYAHLDAVDFESYGPEIITVHRYVRSGSGVYQCFVENFWDGFAGVPPLAGCGAKVCVQSSTAILKTFICPSRGEGQYWHVFNMTSRGGIITVNRIVNSMP